MKMVSATGQILQKKKKKKKKKKEKKKKVTYFVYCLQMPPQKDI